MSVPYIFANLSGPIPLTDLDYNFAAVEADIASLANGSTSMTTPVLGIPASGNLTNCSNYNAANLAGTIANSQLAYNSVTINGSTIVLGASTTVTANTTNNLTFNNSGSGVASGSAFNGSTAYTISYNTIGASPLAGSTSLTTLGTITTGTWNGAVIQPAYIATLNQNTTGTASNVTGIVTIANGGTNASTASGARTNLGLGSAALLTAGTSANNAVQLDGSAKLPAVDGSQLTNITASSMTLLGTIATTSGTSASLTGLNLTGYKQIQCQFNTVKPSGSAQNLIFNGKVLGGVDPTTGNAGMMTIDLTSGFFTSIFAKIGSTVTTSVDASGLTTASTSITFTITTAFNGGSILVYGVK